DFELLDTPGILWPKFEDQQVGLKLAFTGAINDDILDPENMALAFINHMVARDPDCIRSRYQVEFDSIEEPHVILEKIAIARGFKKKGDEPDLERTGKIIMDEYRGGKLGKITLELPEDIDVMMEKKAEREAEKALLDKERKRVYNKKKK
ncbi:MAG: ribosome biogenesis GTPase YlqF, partial [Bacillota bacterium]|nr:ribosome biogenesis GTPase YlqF [Bacillota bacterium]